MTSSYVVAGSRPWNQRTFDERLRHLPGTWRFVASPAELELALASLPETRAVFFLHWSEKVSEQVVGRVECVNFHMTDLPFGRGGSPLQNLIAEGHAHSVLTALRMTSEFDAGPVYAKRDLCLRGTAEEVFIRASEVAADMIETFLDGWPVPVDQEGEATVFRRRRPSDSRISTQSNLDRLHDFIRMLDAEGYPPAFLEYEGFRMEFRRSARYDGRLEADVTVTLPDGGR